MQRILVIRFSAMGDVAMVASVLRELHQQHENLETIMVSRKAYRPFFAAIPHVTYHEVDLNGHHSGFFGMCRLFRELLRYKAYRVADLHNNIRSRFLDFLFLLSDYSVRILNKGRKEKRSLTRPTNKVLKPLKHTAERYADVFRALGFQLKLEHKLTSNKRPIPVEYKENFQTLRKRIGIAPFAQHAYKVFPLEKMEKVVAELSKQGHEVYIFGGGKIEHQVGSLWERNYQNVFNTIGRGTLVDELDLIANLDFMISMDSSGMHMASLVGTRCVSLWGATHPFTGFLGYGQRLSDCIQVDHPNRPSSVYGNKPCICDGVEAIDLITPEMITEKISLILGS